MIFALLFMLSAIFLYWCFKKLTGLPPGQWGLPVLGVLPFIITKRFDKYVQEMAKKYGNVFWIGSRLFIGLGDYETVKSAYALPEFSSRSHLKIFTEFNENKNIGIVDAEGEVWKNNRRFILRHSRDFGFGKSTYEAVIMKEVTSLVNELRMSANSPTEIGYVVNVAMFNVAWRIVANKRYDVNDPKIQYFGKLLQENFAAFESPIAAFDFLPFLAKVIPNCIQQNQFGYRNLVKSFSQLKDFYKMEITEHIEKLDRNNPKDLIDVYLIEQENSAGLLQHVEDHVANLVSLMEDFFVAGSHTTAQTILWFFVYMALHPKIQKKLQNQIDEMIPRDRFPSFEDKEKLPYVEAAVHELHRKISLAPVGVPHAVNEDTKLHGFHIPKGALVVANLMGIHHSDKHYEKPNEFCIEHFLDKNGKFCMKKSGYIPLSIGRRSCIGEPLVRVSAFVFQATLLQQFDIQPVPGQKLTTEPAAHISVSNEAPKFKILLKERF